MALHRHPPLLSRLHRRAEALDAACLRALGHPHDHGIRQELLSALEWSASYHPEHARPAIRSMFREVHDHSADLSQHIQSGTSHLVSGSIASLRKSLASLTHVLAKRHNGTPED
jgi:lysyl-tRNA synthetase class I